MKVLVVHSESSVLSKLREVTEALGLGTVTVTDAQWAQAVSEYHPRGFDLVMTQLNKAELFQVNGSQFIQITSEPASSVGQSPQVRSWSINESFRALADIIVGALSISVADEVWALPLFQAPGEDAQPAQDPAQSSAAVNTVLEVEGGPGSPLVIAGEQSQSRSIILELPENDSAPEPSQINLPPLEPVAIPKENNAVSLPSTKFEMKTEVVVPDPIPTHADAKEAKKLFDYLYDDESPKSPSRSPSQPDLSLPDEGFGITTAPTSEESDALRKTLVLRERDMAALTAQLRSAQSEVLRLQSEVQSCHLRIGKLETEVESGKQKVVESERSMQMERSAILREIESLKERELKQKDRMKILEAEVQSKVSHLNELKERVKIDLKKIRMRESELEGRVEILKADTASLVASRENKINELKRRIDFLEFNIELVQERYSREMEKTRDLQTRLEKATQALRVAENVLEVRSPHEQTINTETAKSERAS